MRFASVFLLTAIGITASVAAAPPAKSSADLSITKTDSPDPVMVGADLTYSISVANGGPAQATGVTSTDALPGSVEFVSASSNCTGTATITCSFGKLQAGASASASIKVRPKSAGTITNTASVNGSQSDPNTQNNSSSASTTVTAPTPPAPAVADLSATMNAWPDPVATGDVLSYGIGLYNRGPSTATGVKVTDVLPANVDLEAASSPGGCMGTTTVTCDVGSLASESYVSVQINVRARAEGTVENSADVTADTPDPNPTNNTASASTTIQSSGRSADLSVSATMQKTLDVTEFDITVANAGPDAANETSLVFGARAWSWDQYCTYPIGLPCVVTRPAKALLLRPANNVVYLTAEPSQGTCTGAPGVAQTTTSLDPTIPGTYNDIRCALGSLAPNATATVKIRVQATGWGEFQGFASVRSTDSDPDIWNNYWSPWPSRGPIPFECELDNIENPVLACVHPT